MINAIIRFSLKQRLFVIGLALLLLVLGGLVVVQLPVDVFPDLNRPTVTIMTEAAGLAPEEVETLVSLPLETAMNGLPGVSRIRSTSAPGLSVVYVEFGWNTEIYRARQLVAEKLQGANLPRGLTPTMAPIASIMGEILLVGISSPSLMPMDLRTIADWTLRPHLLTIPGVAQVIPIGGGVRQVQVKVSPTKLKQYRLSLADVQKALGKSNLNTTGGFLDNSSQEYLVRNLGRAESLEDIAGTVVALEGGQAILMRQVAEIRYGIQTKRGDASVNARPAVILSIQKQPGTDTLKLTQEVEKAIDAARKTLPADVKVEFLFKQANFIEAAVRNVEEALRDGGILVVIVLIIFLANVRTTLITLTAIPLSFVITALFFHASGISINTMTLGGMAVAIGELVDDAIVDVENIFRRLKENQGLEAPRPAFEVIFDASAEIRGSIVYATLIVIMVFLPLFALGGIEGKLFNPMAVSYIVSLFASLAVSLTVTPVLCYFLLPRAKAMQHHDSRVVRWLKAGNTRMLNLTLDHAGLAFGITLVLIVGAAALFPLMGKEFLPAFNEGTATINVLSRPGTSLAESNRIGTLAEQLILKVPEVLSTGRRTGRAELDEHAEGVHYSEIDVDFKRSTRSREAILGDLRTNLSQIPGVLFNIGQPISHRLDHLLSGVRAQVAVKLFGADLAQLRSKAGEISAVMAKIPGVVDLQVEQQVLIPQLQIKVNRQTAQRYGLQAGEITEWLETALNGQVIDQVLEGQKILNLVLRLDEPFRKDPDTIGDLLMDTPTGEKIPLRQVATIQTVLGPNQVLRESVQRRIVVFCNTAGRDLGSVVQDIQQALDKNVKLPEGYFLSFEGQFQSQQEATRLISLLGLLSLAGVFVLLYSHFQSANLALQVMAIIPMSLVGAVGAIFISGRVFSIASLVGFIALTGIASRNSIMKISHYLHLMRAEGESFTRDMIIRGANERLVPVLMTASCAGFALIPLAFSAGAPGKEILQPLAVVILGGLTSATLLDSLITPVIFWRFGKKAVEKVAANDGFV